MQVHPGFIAAREALVETHEKKAVEDNAARAAHAITFTSQ
jgi:hypothetical protein